MSLYYASAYASTSIGEYSPSHTKLGAVEVLLLQESRHSTETRPLTVVQNHPRRLSMELKSASRVGRVSRNAAEAAQHDYTSEQTPSGASSGHPVRESSRTAKNGMINVNALVGYDACLHRWALAFIAWANMIPKTRNVSKAKAPASQQAGSESTKAPATMQEKIVSKPATEKRKRAESIAKTSGEKERAMKLKGAAKGMGGLENMEKSSMSERRQPKKAKLTISAAPKPVEVHQKQPRAYAPPKVMDDSDKEHSESDRSPASRSIQAPSRLQHGKSRGMTHCSPAISSVDIEDALNESGEEGDSISLQEHDAECSKPQETCDDFDAELQQSGLPQSRSTTRSQSLSSSDISTFAGGPPETDSVTDGDAIDEALNGLSEVLSSDEEEVNSIWPSKKQCQVRSAPLTKNQKRKLKEEMPEINTSNLNVTSNEAPSVGWLPHTKIEVIPSPRSFRIELLPQNAEIQQVIRCSYCLCNRLIAFHGWHKNGENVLDLDLAALKTLVTLLQKEGLDLVARKALIDAADSLGYDGEHDITDRLEHGSFPDYVKPLVAYVSHRLSFFRSAIKKAVTSLVQQRFELLDEKPEGVPDKADLAKAFNYIYPWSPT
ncbi:hypothetical protein DAEQUDRAFT_741201, partial [Daedalea quercina L-15889]